MGTPRLTVHVDKDRCEGHALCVQNAPEVFDIGDDDMAIWEEHPPAEAEKSVEAAVAACPRQAITVSEQT